MGDAAAMLETSLNNLYNSISNKDKYIQENNGTDIIDDNTKIMCNMIKLYRSKFNSPILNKEAKIRLLKKGKEVQLLFKKYNDSCQIIDDIIKEQDKINRTPKNPQQQVQS